MSPVKQTEGKSKSEKGKTVAERSKARTTKIPTMTTEQASVPPSDVLTTELVVIPTDDWCRTWATDRTMLLRMNSTLEESQRGGGQASPDCCCEGEQDLEGRRPSRHSCRTSAAHSETARENDVPVTHHKTISLQLQHQWPSCREASRGAGTVPWPF
jgi:hypothetical protein